MESTIRPARRIARVDDVVPLPGDGQVFRRNLVLAPGHFREHDPFLLMGEDWFGRPLGFPAHPHRGFETVTYLIDGAVEHHDNRGNHGVLRAGDVQWMTAGRGIIHSEMPHGDEPVHLLQLWLNLPASKKRVDTRYQDLRAADMPVREEPGARLRVYSGASGGVRASTLNHWPITMVEARLDAGAEVAQELPPRTNGFLYVLSGRGHFGADETEAHAGQVLHLAPNSDSDNDSDGESLLTLRADEPLFALLFAGEPIGEPVVARGPFVMNTLDEVNQAYADYHAGSFGD